MTRRAMTNRGSPTFPFVTLIIPVTGASAALTGNIKSLINQTYQAFDIIFVLQDKNDSATDFIVEICKTHKQTTLLYSGKATSCSQKNHNLLAGIQKAGNNPELLVCCDSGHVAPSDWLHCLIQPFLLHESCVITSGYHQIHPKKHCIYSQGRAICVLTLSLIRKLPFLGQPWGGATAIRRETFEDLFVAEMWKNNIVDDVSLAKLLQTKNISVTIPDHSDLQTYLVDESLQSWTIWLTRQWAYLKFIFPELWFATGFLSLVCAVSVLTGFFICVMNLAFPVPLLLLQCSAATVLLFSIFTSLDRKSVV